MIKLKKFLSSGLAILITSLFPLIAGAQGTLINIDDVVSRATKLGNVFIVLLISLAVIFIIYNVVIYIIGEADSEKRKESWMRIIWGIVGLAVILSIWGLVGILRNSFRTNDRVPVNDFPQVVRPPSTQ